MFEPNDQLAAYDGLSPAGRALFAEFVCHRVTYAMDGRYFLETVQECLRLAVQADIDQALRRIEP